MDIRARPLSAILAHLKEGRLMYDRHDLRWDGHRLRMRSGSLLATIVPDPDWDGMWRVRMPNGHVSDMVNLTRAKDAAQLLALVSLNASAPRSRCRDDAHRSGAACVSAMLVQ